MTAKSAEKLVALLNYLVTIKFTKMYNKMHYNYRNHYKNKTNVNIELLKL